MPSQPPLPPAKQFVQEMWVLDAPEAVKSILVNLHYRVCDLEQRPGPDRQQVATMATQIEELLTIAKVIKDGMQKLEQQQAALRPQTKP